MKYRISLVFGLMMLGLLAGCASSVPQRSLGVPTNSLVFGYIDMGNAPTSIKSAWIMQVAPPSDTPYWCLGITKGLFYSSHLPPGSYQLSKFSGLGFFAGEQEYSFPRQGNHNSLRISKPGIYFLGSFKYRKVKTGMFSHAKYAIEKMNQPTEAELLRRILDEDDEIKNSAWGHKIRARLAQLNS